MISEKDLVRHELIGLKVEVIRAKNRYLIGIRGKVVDETKYLLVIETRKGEKKVLKAHAIFKFTLPSGKKVIVNGLALVGRPEERVKMKPRVRSRWLEI